MSRLGRQPGEQIDRESRLSFTWNGARLEAYEGDTIASALAASGVRLISRSFKYHRPRGLLTADFLDPGCVVQAGDEPNVRGGHRLVTDGMRVSSQNTWPSLKFDVKAANRFAGRFLTAGFYYKTFIKPQRLWPAYERVLQRFVNAGEVSPDTEHEYYDKRYAHPDVLIAGGGPAGLAAAVSAAEDGARVLLVEEEHRLGGHLRWGGREQLDRLARLRRQIAEFDSIEVMTDATVLGRYDDNWVSVVQRTVPGGALVPTERLVKARAKALVVAAGLIERPYVFQGNDLPGVMLSTGVRRLINLYAVKPGRRAVVLTANDEGDAAAEDLRRAGVDVVHVEDARSGGDIVRAHGRGGLRSVDLAGGGSVDCDLLVTATGWTTPTSLLNMAGDRPQYDASAARFVPQTDALPDGVLATGGIVGDGNPEELAAHGAAVGRAAARQARAFMQGFANVPTRPDDASQLPPPGDPVALPALRPAPHRGMFLSKTHGFVDFSEDVTTKDIKQAVAEGYDSIELAKRYTTATMGTMQGKLELMNTIAAHAHVTGSSIAATGTTTWRPPYAPVSLGALAGRVFEPVRHSPMHEWHEEHGGVPLVAGAWIRPDHYGDAQAEARNVRESVGVIDVTPIGKLDLRGPDVPKLLEQLYVNKWQKLGLGRVRYGVMCAEDGVILDDGVTGRLGEEHYLMSTTSSGAAGVWEWVENWLQTEHPDWRVHVTPVTTAYASMNLAGPRSRELLERLVDDVDLSTEAFPYMRVRTGTVAGVPDCVFWRIGFTGELSYELHVPASYGLHVWEQLFAYGEDLGIRPFGVEAQRILRLEKGHFIVGQDTDGLTKGYSAGLDWAIKLDKADFAGMPELRWQAEGGDYPKLVPVQPVDPAVVPEEASQIVEGSRIVGRITSSRMSPTLRRSICLAQVESRLAEPGTQFTVLLPDGKRIAARVHEDHAHVDPGGERQRV
ncbi:FAD-dependent oxidoreductase [Streptomyces sp. HNM0575]|uniref:2Fe-2S iron-sulfur cluster-binding protein n=1 Tax=Streptomyces sp. HNM0575 TaxID=2716338 RepID=UPI00145CD9EB|nr:2Fe-2S iron-sulfur cluster-binding protein [Streptomyces sp. HNM0575]NLU72651.1 FAD-dependent oxidoreductase [Streptomyces sp. HNM0575]